MIPRSIRILLVALFSAATVAACSGGPGGSASTPASTPVASPPGSAIAGGPSGCPGSQPKPLAATDVRTVSIETSKGTIVIKVTGKLSPIATANFVALASCGFYTGVVFHRVVPGFVIQGGDGEFGRASNLDRAHLGQGGPGYTIQDEPVTTVYKRGTVAMARSSQPNSVGSQFFIVLDDSASQSLADPSTNNYQIIGSVEGSLSAVDQIAAAADAEIPSSPVVMTKVTVSNP